MLLLQLLLKCCRRFFALLFFVKAFDAIISTTFVKSQLMCKILLRFSTFQSCCFSSYWFCWLVLATATTSINAIAAKNLPFIGVLGGWCCFGRMQLIDYTMQQRFFCIKSLAIASSWNTSYVFWWRDKRDGFSGLYLAKNLTHSPLFRFIGSKPIKIHGNNQLQKCKDHSHEWFLTPFR